MRGNINFLFDELITCGAVISTFELAEALIKKGYDVRIISRHKNEELEKYFKIKTQKRWEKGLNITCTPKLVGGYAYVRTKDGRWLNHTEPKICVSEWIADWIGGTVVGNGTHERFYNMNLDRDIDVLIEGNDEPNKNIEETIKKAKEIGEKVVWFGRQTKEVPGIVNISSPPFKKIPLLYNRSKVFLKMSKEEGWGRPVAEAKACGCKVINLSGGNRKVKIESWDLIADKFIECVQSHLSETT